MDDCMYMSMDIDEPYQKTKRPIYLENTSLTYVDAYIYLGKQVSFNQQNNELEVERRVNITWKKFWSLKEIPKSAMTIGMETRVMNTCLLPSLTYACHLHLVKGVWKEAY
ncbi:hypothetical protein EVAR_339_1 [Eumeta japonica]|uniref:Uncharacterized protein n=1 Tax=Eumeta variegata TaxID=151549 RepID=A0A4C1SC08_EUMVA|nr:hypothetical protein EVAR_339_1 [Eumeta japonica]